MPLIQSYVILYNANTHTIYRIPNDGHNNISETKHPESTIIDVN